MPEAILLADEAATALLGEDIAAVLRPGDLVALSGDLGAGKTALARALIRALAGDPSLEVPSPTFPIRIDYALARIPVTHADLYRVGSAGDLDELGLDEVLGDGALLVEWPELLPPDLATDRLDIRLSLAGSGRSAELQGSGTWPSRLDRTAAIRAFLDRSGWREARRTPLAGDASSRAYERITTAAASSFRFPAGKKDARPAVSGGSSAVLMNAPARPEGPPLYDGRSYDALAKRALDVRPFLAIGGLLRGRGFRAPQVFASDPEAGLLLVEDLGHKGLVDDAGAPILARYEAAIDTLTAMHAEPWPEHADLPDGSRTRIPPYDREALLVEVSLFPDWSGHGGEPKFTPDERAGFLQTWSEILARIANPAPVLVLRDFHSPNIIWQSDAAGTDRIGLIDFQDALLGHPAYDVASLGQDARVPLTPEQETHLKDRYIAARHAHDPRFDKAAFETAYAVLAAQRATKVLGAFTRLALAEGKPGYQRHRTRLKELLRRSLAHPVLSPLRLWYEPTL